VAVTLSFFPSLSLQCCDFKLSLRLAPDACCDMSCGCQTVLAKREVYGKTLSTVMFRMWAGSCRLLGGGGGVEPSRSIKFVAPAERPAAYRGNPLSEEVVDLAIANEGSLSRHLSSRIKATGWRT
jgi:hypothetical protein